MRGRSGVRVPLVAGCLIASAFCGLASAATFTGTVFEDANYGGGAGRSLAASGGTGIANVRVELYRVSDGALIDTDDTIAGGTYSLSSGNTNASRQPCCRSKLRSALRRRVRPTAPSRPWAG